MSASKYDGKDEKFSDDGKDYADYADYADSKSSKDSDFPRIEITSIDIDSSKKLITDPLEFRITFELDRFYTFNVTVIR